MEDLEGHCAGEQGCDPFEGFGFVSHRDAEMCCDEVLKEGFSWQAIKCKIRLTAARLEDKFPKMYNFVNYLGIPRPYEYNR
jgi:hypothetical protein